MIKRINTDHRLPSIPQYFSEYVDKSIDLNVHTSIPCPFHGEVHGKSLSYKPDAKIWSCFGACHVYGADVIEMHRLNYKLRTREEAEQSLYAMYGIKKELDLTFEKKEVEVSPEQVHRRRMLALAINLANEPKDWEELDFLVSQVPYDVKDLEMFCSSRGFSVLANDT